MIVLNELLRMMCLVLALGAVVAGAELLAAQPAPAATDGFVPVGELPAVEQLPAAPLVLVAYAFIWVAVLAYVWQLWRRLAAVQKDLDALRRTIQR